MTREELVSEISMRMDIPLEDVEDVLDEADVIKEECARKKKKKKRMCILITLVIFIAGAVSAILVLDKKEKIDAEELMKKYSDKLLGRINDIQGKINQKLDA